MAVIKFNQDFKDLAGKILYGEKECCILKPNGELAKANGKFVTRTVETPEDKLELKQVCIESLLTDSPEENPDLKDAKYTLFKKFHEANGEIDITAEDLVLVKAQIRKVYSTFIMGQAHEMLEGK